MIMGWTRILLRLPHSPSSDPINHSSDGLHLGIRSACARSKTGMAVRRICVFLLVFGMGIGVGMMMLRASVARPVTASEAQRRALRLLDQPPVVTPVGDNKIVAAVRRIEPAVVNIDTVG